MTAFAIPTHGAHSHVPCRAVSRGHTHRGLAEPVEVDAQVCFDAINGSRKGDSSQEQGEEDHIWHGGRDPHDLGEDASLAARPPVDREGAQVTLRVCVRERWPLTGKPHIPDSHRPPAQQKPTGMRLLLPPVYCIFTGGEGGTDTAQRSIFLHLAQCRWQQWLKP